MQRYIRAFVTTLKLMLRGEVLQNPLEAWRDEALKLLAQVQQAAAQGQIDPATLRLQIDRREITMAVILATLDHNLRTVYPRLLQSPGSSNMLYATNLDDHFRLSRLAAALPAGTALQAALEALTKHLEAVPGPEN